MDIIKDLENFLKKNPPRFKLVFLDIGINSGRYSYPTDFQKRLVKGGILIFDQYNHELAPGETLVIEKHLKGKKLEQLRILGCQTRI